MAVREANVCGHPWGTCPGTEAGDNKALPHSCYVFTWPGEAHVHECTYCPATS